jgi:hypothetical protein
MTKHELRTTKEARNSGDKETGILIVHRLDIRHCFVIASRIE